MGDSERTPSAAQVTLVAVSLAGLLIFWAHLLGDQVVRRSPAEVASPSAASKIEEKASEDLFEWSNDTQDWTLVRRGAEESAAPSGHPRDPSECVWPEDDCPPGDRIVNQLLLAQSHGDKFFKIAWANDPAQPLGREVFLRNECRVNKCLLSDQLEEADAIIWPNSDVPLEPSERPPGQVWIAYLLESPPNTYDRRLRRRHRGQHEFNWTASYRSDSDLVTPYSKFVPYSHSNGARSNKPMNRSDRVQIEARYEQASPKHRQLIRGKQGARVAWLVSNCHAKNERLEYARELSRFIHVDIYGKCGNLICLKADQAECLAHLNQNYKFYLSFENSNSREYITEKLYRNAYAYNDPNHLLLPIVMGPSRHDYKRLVPPESFLHVDDFESPKHLAHYLHKLADDHALYYSYFHWKTMGRFIDTKFLCRLCAMLHHRSRTKRGGKVYEHIQDWWWLDE